jgi:hypothetical protein
MPCLPAGRRIRLRLFYHFLNKKERLIFSKSLQKKNNSVVVSAQAMVPGTGDVGMLGIVEFVLKSFPFLYLFGLSALGVLAGQFFLVFSGVGDLSILLSLGVVGIAPMITFGVLKSLYKHIEGGDIHNPHRFFFLLKNRFELHILLPLVLVSFGVGNIAMLSGQIPLLKSGFVVALACAIAFHRYQLKVLPKISRLCDMQIEREIAKERQKKRIRELRP